MKRIIPIAYLLLVISTGIQACSEPSTSSKPDLRLHDAAKLGDLACVQALLAARANPNAQDFLKQTPLHLAALNGHIEIIKALLAAGANPNVQDGIKQTPLHYAAGCGNLACVQALLAAGADPDAQDTNKWTPLHLAAQYGHIEIIKALLAAGANPNVQDGIKQTPLHYTARYGNLACVQALLAAGADPDAQDTNKWTPLHWAARYGHTETIKALLAAGANPNAQDGIKQTPLHSAVLGGQTEIVKALLVTGANPNALDGIKRTPLHRAVENGFTEIVDYLNAVPRLAAELKVAVQDHDIDKILSLITQGAPLIDEHGDCFIHKAIGTYYKKNPTDEDTYVRKLLQTAGPLAVGIQDRDGRTLLHIVAMQNNCWIAKLVLPLCPAVNFRDKYGNTALHYAQSVFMRKKLMQHGADESLVNAEGHSPIPMNPLIWPDFFEKPAAQQQ